MKNDSFGDLVEMTQATGSDSENTKLVMFILWGIVLPIVVIMGLIGNFLTMAVLFRKEMKSSSIYYLRLMAITDTGILIGSVIFLTPISIANYTEGRYLIYFKTRVYPLIHTPGYYVIMTLQQCNVWITVAVALERYIAICHPFRAAFFSGRRTTIRIMICIGIFSMIYNIPHLFATYATRCELLQNNRPYTEAGNTTSVKRRIPVFVVIPRHKQAVTTLSTVSLNMTQTTEGSFNVSLIKSQYYDPDCMVVTTTAFGQSKIYNLYRTILYAAIVHVVPLSTLIFLNSFLVKELMVMQRRQTGTNISDENEANLSLILVLIVVVFIICQTPGLISQFEIIPRKNFHTWLAVANLLFVTNSAVNFLIYTAFGRKFRQVLLRLFRRLCGNPGRKSTFSNWAYAKTDGELRSVGNGGIVQNRRSELITSADVMDDNGVANESKPLKEASHEASLDKMPIKD